MTAYELSEIKNNALRQIDSLHLETVNNTETVLLTNEEVFNIIEFLTVEIELIDDRLKKIDV